MEQKNNLSSPVIIDANIWIALFHRTDTLHKKAIDIMRLFEKHNTTFIVPSFIIQEIMTVLLYKKQSRLIDLWLRFIENNNALILHTDDEILLKTSRLMQQKKYTPKLSYTDWYLCALSQYKKWPLVTFDKQLHRLSKK